MFRVSSEKLDAQALSAELANCSSGALVTFEGWVRDHNEGQPVESLEYQVYYALALKEGQKLLAEAQAKFDIQGVLAVHREGHLAIGDVAVWVGATAAHRGVAFDACQFVIDEIKHRLPIWKKEHYTQGEAKWVYCSDHAHSPKIKVDETAYYSRQLDLPDVGVAGQQRLKESQIVVVGAGGLGCPALTHLVTAGVGHVTIVDGDTVAVSNLHRQTLFATSDIGANKAHAAKQHLQAMNPLVEITALPGMLSVENVREIIATADVVLDCTDNLTTKYLLNDACYLAKIPFVVAAIYQWQGILHTFLPNSDSGCFRCLSEEAPASDCVGSCVDSGVIGVIPGLVGGMQAAEALRLLLGQTPVTACSSALIDLRSLSLMKFKRKKNTACLLCGLTPTITDICPETYEPAKRDETLADFEIDYESYLQRRECFKPIDIRSDMQRALSESNGDTFANSMPHINLTRLQVFRSLPDNEQYLLVCEHGISSKYLADILQAEGRKNFYSLVGGLTNVRGELT